LTLSKTVSEWSMDAQGFGFLVVADVDDYAMRFKLYEIVGVGTETESDVRYFERDGATIGGDFVIDPAEATIWAEGHIKWDGCSEWDIAHFHSCGQKGLARQLAAAVDAITMVAKKYMSGWDNDLSCS
jgi:hypothetical protein